jgi:hypothetical protein
MENPVLLLHRGDEEDADVEDGVAEEAQRVQHHKVHVQTAHTFSPEQSTILWAVKCTSLCLSKLNSTKLYLGVQKR